LFITTCIEEQCTRPLRQILRYNVEFLFFIIYFQKFITIPARKQVICS